MKDVRFQYPLPCPLMSFFQGTPTPLARTSFMDGLRRNISEETIFLVLNHYFDPIFDFFSKSVPCFVGQNSTRDFLASFLIYANFRSST